MKKLLAIALSMVAVACSSSGGDSSTYGLPTKQISGKVSDPAIKDARVVLLDSTGKQLNNCGVLNNSPCQTFTNNEGAFVFLLPLDADTANYTLKTYGGSDTLYKTSFENLSLYSTSLSKYSNQANIIVSPITSLIKSYVDLGSTDDEAIAEVARALSVGSEKLFLDPETDDETLRAAYNVARNAINKGGENPFKDIAIIMKDNKTLLLNSTDFRNILFAGNTIIQSLLNEELANLNTLNKENIGANNFASLFVNAYKSKLGDVVISDISLQTMKTVGENLFNLILKDIDYVQDDVIVSNIYHFY